VKEESIGPGVLEGAQAIGTTVCSTTHDVDFAMVDLATPAFVRVANRPYLFDETVITRSDTNVFSFIPIEGRSKHTGSYRDACRMAVNLDAIKDLQPCIHGPAQACRMFSAAVMFA
jgi:hypothetical protein